MTTMSAAKVETIRRPRNVIERLLDAVERVSAIREHAEPVDRRHISRALDEAKTAAADNDGDRIMRAVRLLECIKGDVIKTDPGVFQWPSFIEPKTTTGSGYIGLALLQDGFRTKGQNVPVNSEHGVAYLIDIYVRGDSETEPGETVWVKVPPRAERMMVSLA